MAEGSQAGALGPPQGEGRGLRPKTKQESKKKQRNLAKQIVFVAFPYPLIIKIFQKI